MAKRKKKPNLHDAMRHPLRKTILIRMADGGLASPTSLAEHIDESMQNIAYHVRVLAHAGALSLVRTEPRRGTVEHFYRFSVKEPWALSALGIKA